MISSLHVLSLIHLLTSSSQSAQPTFNGAEAYEVLVDLSLRGQRYYEAPKRDEQLTYLSQLLDSYGQQITIQTFTDQLPGQSKVYTLHNIIAQSPSLNPNRILLASHWDTRAWAEKASKKRQQKKPIQGANDGTSGLATILEILSVLQERPLQNIAVDVIFFDGGGGIGGGIKWLSW